jgi:hypothetical protein
MTLLLQYRLQALDHYSLGGPLSLGFALQNRSRQDVWVLKWYTPLEGLRGRILAVQCDDVEIPYEGRMMKRGEPTSGDYVLIAAGSEVQSEFDLATSYSLIACTVCRVAFRGTLRDVFTAADSRPGQIARPSSEHRTLSIQGNEVRFRLTA